MTFLTAVALAEHEADHRYVVEGFVLDAGESPMPGQAVVVTAEGEVLGRTETDHRGHYSVQLHLHNPDYGKELTVKAGDREGTITVTFDPEDRTSERGDVLNFVGANTTQDALAGFRGLPTWWYVVFGVVILAVVARSLVQALKMRRRRQEKEKKKQQKKKQQRKKHKKATRERRK